MNSIDSDLSAWRRQWLSLDSVEPIPDLPQYVARETRRARIGLLAPVAVTLGMGGGLVWKAVTSGEPADASLAAGMWFFIACAWSGCLWLTRGTWHSRSETTAAYIELSIARCESWVRATPFAIALYLGELGFMLQWTLRYTERSLPEVLTTGTAIVFGWIGIPGLFVAAAWLRRNKQSQRDRLLALKQQFSHA